MDDGRWAMINEERCDTFIMVAGFNGWQRVMRLPQIQPSSTGFILHEPLTIPDLRAYAQIGVT